MRRRSFITLLGGAAAAWPLAVGAQTLRHRPLVGSLQVQSLTGSARYASEFLRGMAELGYVEGRNIDFERRYAAGDLRRLPALANELVNLKPDVILTTTSDAATSSCSPVREHRDSIPEGAGPAGQPSQGRASQRRC